MPILSFLSTRPVPTSRGSARLVIYLTGTQRVGCREVLFSGVLFLLGIPHEIRPGFKTQYRNVGSAANAQVSQRVRATDSGCGVLSRPCYHVGNVPAEKEELRHHVR